MESSALILGLIPGAFGSMARLNHLDVGKNRISGTLPLCLASLTSTLSTLNFGDNRLAGSLFQWLVGLVALKHLHVLRNELEGNIPERIRDIAHLSSIVATQNLLRGTLPDSLGSLQDLGAVALGFNSITGTIPRALVSLALVILLLDGNGLEGTLPSALKVRWRKVPWHNNGLEVLGLSGSSQFKVNEVGLQGPVPQTLERAICLHILLGHRQRMGGAMPNLEVTFLALGIQNNVFRALQPRLRFKSDSLIFLHQNRLSCHVPLCKNMSLKRSLVALGNRFQIPRSGVLPDWVAPAEQDGLFWVKPNEGMKLLLQACGAWTVYFLALARCVGLQKSLHFLSQWCASIGPLQQASCMLRGCALRHVMVACCLLLSVADCRMYVCPRTLEWASAGLSATHCTHILVVVAWLHLYWQASQPWWLAGPASWGKVSETFSGWILTVLLVVAMYPCAGVVVAAKFVPGFLGLDKYWLKTLSTCIGCCQGLASSMVIPRVVEQVSGSRKHMYVSAASICTTCILPGLTVLYFSESCLGHWMLW